MLKVPGAMKSAVGEAPQAAGKLEAGEEAECDDEDDVDANSCDWEGKR